jgi:diguanylate cyclase (GGDEF)-like protein
MGEFFRNQMDYIFFFYGLSFLIMAAICFTMKQRDTSLPWITLGLFGVTHGLNEWLDMIALSIGDNPLFSIFRTIVMIFSFVFLAEFGRVGMSMRSGKETGKWIYILPAILIVIAGAYGWQGVNAASRYTLGLTGGLLSAAVLYLSSRGATGSARSSLAAGGAGMGLYVLATGLVVPEAPFFPANIINHGSFLKAFGFPIQLARGLFAIVTAVSVWFYSQTTFGELMEENYRRYRMVFAVYMALTVIIIILVGWFVTDHIGRYQDIAIYRLASINGVCVLSTLTVAFFVVWQKAKESEMQIEALSLTDHLTGLANRRLMDVIFDRYLVEAGRYGRELSVLMADIDYFKKYNDTYGHQAGDRLLSGTAELMVKETREADLVARYGGEEFVIILPETGLKEARRAAERIRRAVESRGEVTISLGVSSCREGTVSKEELIGEADEALYRAKENGRNRVEIVQKINSAAP